MAVKMTIHDYLVFKQLKDEAALDGITIVVSDVMPDKLAEAVAPARLPTVKNPWSMKEAKEYLIDLTAKAHRGAAAKTLVRDDLLKKFGWSEETFPRQFTHISGVRRGLSMLMEGLGWRRVGKYGATAYLLAADAAPKAIDGPAQ